MTEPFDTTTDPLLDALLALLVGGLNATLGAEIGADVVARSVSHPAPQHLAPSQELPLLSVHRGKQTVAQTGIVSFDTTTTLIVDYILPAVDYERAHLRWPFLHRVWRRIVSLVIDGRHASVADGADVLSDAGMIRLVLNEGNNAPTYQPVSIEIVEPEVEESARVYPSFRATLTVISRDVSEEAADVAEQLRSLYARFVLIDGDVETEHVVEEVILAEEAGTTSEPIGDDRGLEDRVE